MTAYTPLPEAPAVEKSIAFDMLRRGVVVAPVAIAVAALLGGGDVAASVAYGIAIVLVNLLLSALMLGWAAKQTPTILMMVALGGFFQQPVERVVAGAIEIRGDAGPIDVHVHGQRGGRRDVTQPTRQLGVAM